MKKDKLKIYCDGGARGNPGPAAAAFVVLKNRTVFHQESKYLGKATNNVAEYEAVLLAWHWLANQDFKSSSVLIEFYLDSNLVVNQLSGNFKIKNENLWNLYHSIKSLEKKNSMTASYQFIRRSQNKRPDDLVNEELDRHASKNFTSP